MGVTFSAKQRDSLLEIARKSIEAGLKVGHPFTPDPMNYDEELRQHRACFVTLFSNEQLRGCIGTLEAEFPIVIAVAQAAFSAAFRDPRFAPLHQDEWESLSIHLSILSESEPIEFESETELIEKLRPGVDGLILEEENHRGTLLPSVWETHAEPRQFLQMLKVKAGLMPDYWSDQIRMKRYTTESFEE